MKRLTCWIWLTDSPRRKSPGSKVLACEVSRALLIYNDLSSANHRHPTSTRRSGRPVCLLHIDSSSLTLANVKLLDSWKSNERERSPVSSVLICNFSDPVKNCQWACSYHFHFVYMHLECVSNKHHILHHNVHKYYWMNHEYAEYVWAWKKANEKDKGQQLWFFGAEFYSCIIHWWG